MMKYLLVMLPLVSIIVRWKIFEIFSSEYVCGDDAKDSAKGCSPCPDGFLYVEVQCIVAGTVGRKDAPVPCCQKAETRGRNCSSTTSYDHTPNPDSFHWDPSRGVHHLPAWERHLLHTCLIYLPYLSDFR